MFSFMILLLLLFFFLYTTDHPQWINTTNQHSQSTQTDQHTIPTNGSTQQIKNPTNTRSTANPQPTTTTHNPRQTQPQPRFPKPTTHDKPNHNHGNRKTPPTTTVNPQKSQTQNNQKIKRETRSNRWDLEPNTTTAKPTSSCWPPQAKHDATTARSNPIGKIATQQDPCKVYLESLTIASRGWCDHREPMSEKCEREEDQKEKERKGERKFVLKWEKKKKKKSK